MRGLIRPILILLTLAGLSMPIPSFANDDPIPQTSNGDGYTIRGFLWNDTNCDGLRQNDENPLGGNPSGAQRMSLFYIGTDDIPFTRDDAEVGVAGALNGYPTYFFSTGGEGHTYYIAIRPKDRPANFMPSLWQQGSDRLIDNDLRLWLDGAWATGTFVIPNLTGFFNGPDAITGIDIGLCPLASIPRPYQTNLPLVRR